MDEHVHQQAIKDIARLGGHVDTDDRVPGHPVVAADLGRSLVTDSVLVPLQNLKRLYYLILSQTLVTDRVMEVLRVHPEIKRLDISDTTITDGGLKCLKYGTSLEELYLGSRITDEGFRHVKALKKLRVLALEDTGVSDLGLRSIRSLDNLECLFLSARQVSSTSVRFLKELTRLQTINLLTYTNAPDDPTVGKLKQSLPNVRIEW
jgi:Leucine-rich repeat (LRR) protein